MKKNFFNLRNAAKMLVTALAATTMVSCTGGNSNNQSGTAITGTATTSETTQAETAQNVNNTTAENTVAVAFAQFGADVEQVKPNLGTPNKTTLKNCNKVDNDVLNRKAVYMENTEAGISNAKGLAYSERMFNYCKSISADGKCYIDYAGNNPLEAATYEELKAKKRTASWGYKYKGMWVGVGMLFNFDGDTEIGIQLNGMGNY
jgi:hypothetical protein